MLLSNAAVNGPPGYETGPITDLNNPDRNVLPIFNGKVPKQQLLGKIAQQPSSKSFPVYHHLIQS